jgi:LDH2 family malate/lactate/ureidoglycolate dehydrogenase
VTVERRVGSFELRELCAAAFQRCGMLARDAALLADSLVHADLGGVHSHGVLRVPEYVLKMTQGGVDPRGLPSVARDSGAALVVDGGNSMGVIGATFAMDRAIDRAKTTGIAAAAVRGSNHCGALGFFACRASAHDQIGFVTTNALPTMAPFGGSSRVLGINPLAVAIPASEEPPIVYDAAFSASSHGKIRVYQQKGWPLPDGWALGPDGRPTTDPLAAIEGLLQPIGGFKGTGLAMVMGILSSMLSGASYGTELGDMHRGPRAGADGHFLMAIDVAAFEDVGVFKRRVDAAIREVRECPRAPGVERLYSPGEREHLNRAAYSRDGIPLNVETLADLAGAAASLGLNVSGLDWLADLDEPQAPL